MRYASEKNGFGQLAAICQLTVRAGLREAATAAFTLLGCAMVLVAPLFDINLFGRQSRLGAEIVPGTMVVTGLFLAVALAHRIIARERRDGAAALMFSRAVGRGIYIAGKLLGIEIVLIACAICVGAVGIISAALWGISIDGVLVTGVALALGELALLGAAAVFFASLGALPFIAVGLGILFVLGHLAGQVRDALGPVAHVFSGCIPRLDVFVVTGGGLAPGAGWLAVTLSFLSALAGVVFFYAAGTLVYRFREFS